MLIQNQRWRIETLKRVGQDMPTRMRLCTRLRETRSCRNSIAPSYKKVPRRVRGPTQDLRRLHECQEFACPDFRTKLD